MKALILAAFTIKNVYVASKTSTVITKMLMADNFLGPMEKTKCLSMQCLHVAHY